MCKDIILILGLKVFGPIELLSKMYERFKFRHAIIALPADSYEEKRFILKLANKLKLEILTIPAIGLIYFFKNYKTVTAKNFIIANVAVVAILLFIL